MPNLPKNNAAGNYRLVVSDPAGLFQNTRHVNQEARLDAFVDSLEGRTPTVFEILEADILSAHKVGLRNPDVAIAKISAIWNNADPGLVVHLTEDSSAVYVD